jgi:L-asparaginase
MDICIINTGGTISCVGEPLAPMSAKQFATAAGSLLDPIIGDAFPGTTLTYETSLVFPESSTGTLDSTNLQPSDWCLMAQFILTNYASYDGFVILHGTDSMDFTGSALPFLLNVFAANGFSLAQLSKPVIITGSQVPMFYQPPNATAPTNINFNTDAFQNFCGAISCAQLAIPEVCIYFDAKLYRGNRSLKVNASGFRAFDTPNYPPLAIDGINLSLNRPAILPGPVGSDVSLDTPAAMALAQSQLAAVTNAIDNFPVMQFNAFPAAYGVANSTALIANLIGACVGQGIKGLVLESYGEGNFPSGNPDTPSSGAIYKQLAATSASGVVLIDCTQVIAGTVNDSAYASGAWLPQVGALSGSDMTPMAALAKTTVLLAAAKSNNWSLDQVKALIQLNLAGEIQNVSLLDSRTNAALLAGESIMALDGSATLTNDPVAGPLLTSSAGDLLWSPFGSVANGQPGRLVMQDDGNLVLRDADNTPLWATNTGQPSGASSALMIGGSWTASGGTLTLQVYDYSGQQVTASLYSQ